MYSHFDSRIRIHSARSTLGRSDHASRGVCVRARRSFNANAESKLTMAGAGADGASSGTDSIPDLEAPLKYEVRRCAAGVDAGDASDGCSFCSCSASNSSRAGGETDTLLSLAGAAKVWLLLVDWATTEDAASSASPSRIAAEAFRADARCNAAQ